MDVESGSDPLLNLLNYRTAPTKHVLSPADILFNRYMKTRMPSVLEAAVRVTGDLGMYKETDKAKQTAQSAHSLPSCGRAPWCSEPWRCHPGAAKAAGRPKSPAGPELYFQPVEVNKCLQSMSQCTGRF